ncbi:hypothetical protein TAMA11512_00250 [Selenomonas sp. TAMA-11512]|uniref:M23 family metallopeptidase n=1 Tax=Selenomonas sp. TAMA-11512 TaxID=3095337 RepID=UPI00308871C2|nr:hypothetical protein TAMA11512_00250 [Selenomonas sp. TAMA-11512]
MSEKNTSYTLKCIPDNGDTVHTLRLTAKAVRLLIAGGVTAVLLFVAAIGIGAHSFFQSSQEREELLTLRQTTSLQQEELGTLAKKTNAMQQELKDLSREEEKLRTFWGAEQQKEPESSETPVHDGQGGPGVKPTAAMLTTTLDDISNRAAVRRASLTNLYDYIAGLGNFTLTGNTADPSGWPSTGEVSSPYGLRWGGTDFHPGIDIADDYGTPIHATAAGVVTYAGWNGGYGNMVDIKHASGIVTRYAHAEALAVQSGQTVAKGQIIAYMGSTGFSTGPHLHYEVRINGEAVNPISYLR